MEYKIIDRDKEVIRLYRNYYPDAVVSLAKTKLFFVAIDDGKYIAASALAKNGRDWTFGHNVVHGDYQGKGFFNTFRVEKLKYLIEETNARWFQFTYFNHPADFYESIGFKCQESINKKDKMYTYRQAVRRIDLDKLWKI
jgi:predicted GNAT family N-acyltransferase